MSNAERRKGAEFENEICALLRDRLGTAVRRNLSQSRSGTVEGGDILVGKFSLECKRRKKFVGHLWLAQARRDCLGMIPIVVTRGDGCRAIAILDLDVLISLIQGEL